MSMNLIIKNFSPLALAGALAFITGCATHENQSGVTADPICTGGPIITIHDAAPAAGARAVKDGQILAVGAKAEVLKTKGAATQLVDLGGKTLLPGFVAGHGHFCEVGIQTASANLLSPPDGPVQNIAQLQQVLRDFITTSPVVKKHGVVIGRNYDDSQLAEHRHPTLVALKAMTLGPAYQHFEEKTKGSLEVGKLADLVILDKNPLTVEPETIKDIQVMETIKEGKSICRAPARSGPGRGPRG